MNWHLDQATAELYAGGELAGARAASVEAHLLACDACRARLRPVAPSVRLEALWAEIEERVDSPRQTWLVRLLTALRVPNEEARLLAAAPSLQLSWLVALATVLAFAAAATHGGERGMLLFLVLAPLAPVAGVAGAYGRGIDPTYEVTRSTPYSTYRLLLLRVTAVLVTSVLLTSAIALMVSDAWIAAAWLLPSLAMVGLILVMSRWFELPVTAGAVAAMYSAVVGSAWFSHTSIRSLFDTPTQLASLAIVIGCLLVVFIPMHNRAALRRIP